MTFEGNAPEDIVILEVARKLISLLLHSTRMVTMFIAALEIHLLNILSGAMNLKTINKI